MRVRRRSGRAARGRARHPDALRAAGLDLLAAVDELSPPGGVFAAGSDLRDLATGTSDDGFGAEIATRFPADATPTPRTRLTARGWRVRAHAAPDVADRYGRHLAGGVRHVVGHRTLLTAARP